MFRQIFKFIPDPRPFHKQFYMSRAFSFEVTARRKESHRSIKRGLVLGAYNEDNNVIKLTPTAEKFDKDNDGVLLRNLNASGLSKGKSRIFYQPSENFEAVAVVGLGKFSTSYNADEDIDERKEFVRVAAAAGCKNLQSVDISSVEIEDLGDAEACAEGVFLSLWHYQEWKEEKKKKKIPDVHPYGIENIDKWKIGAIQAQAQNFARKLGEDPANYLTPTKFAEIVQEELTKEGVVVLAHNKEWAEKQNMGAFLCVAQGSDEPPKFLEMNYSSGSSEKPIVLVGKGVTFDSGGISIKPSSKMDEMRADMGGAACVVATMKAIAKMKLPLNVIGLTPLCENLPSGRSVKPGDIVKSMNGKYIQVDNTDAEGRLILADALAYACKFNPELTIDLATLTGAMRVALGSAMSGVFTHSTPLYEMMRKAGVITGDRVWRMPLVQAYSSRVTEYPAVDVNNVGKGSGGGACTAAAFLKEFAPKNNWMHMDIAGVFGPDGGSDISYLSGYTGRPTRTLIEFFKLKANTC
ncbi:cytosol aminopeptidase-like isoform X3 [Cimex lectularius]|uniref:Cytosol aminopeptidase n=1 Tax=Cimex lectularius TaxID=79782 RepID=A0A8I6REF8_CIMLE|nr:cytosol aminopeptidase-like isoform X3 [Cimex lectularius]